MVVYPSTPDYFSNIKMLVMPYRGTTSGIVRDFFGWSTEHEISYDAGTMSTCDSTTSQLGTFAFWVR